MPYPRLSGIRTVPYAPASRTKTYTVIRCHSLPPFVSVPRRPASEQNIVLCLSLPQQMDPVLTCISHTGIAVGRKSAAYSANFRSRTLSFAHADRESPPAVGETQVMAECATLFRPTRSNFPSGGTN